ncbi:LuxR C-terminal-related transcriptional regulator [Aquincola sp. MAHUQ-54]|uniref:LuxR C-terminal-related transcriptional regulator n=1 Tax=Aquincola agrisoli TaxID=3119538 RepID=A0AAW9QCS0_9BURK
MLSPRSAEALVRALESAPQVRRRYQFFVWLQSQLHALVPHGLAVCGSYQRLRRDLVFEVFHSAVLPPPLLASLADARTPLIGELQGRWLGAQRRAAIVPLHALEAAGGGDAAMLSEAGLTQLLMHGVSRPQRPAELESFFIFADRQGAIGAQQLLHLELLLPHLHATYLRVQATEHEMNSLPPQMLPRRSTAAAPVTERERQILGWVREGKSNLQIGDLLGISPLTVKNHIQKILRKLGASNRAQAVALAMSRNMLLRSAQRDPLADPDVPE